MLGMGSVAEPVFMARVAWKCSTRSVCLVRMIQRSSARCRNFGSRSLIITPDSPDGLNYQGDASTGCFCISLLCGAEDGTSMTLPFIFLRIVVLSQRSICRTHPAAALMNDSVTVHQSHRSHLAAPGCQRA